MMWLIAGAKGQLGLALTHQLKLKDVKFLALDSKQLDVTDRNQVESVILQLKPDIIVNAAAWTNVDAAEANRSDVFNVNMEGVKNLVLAAKRVNSKFVQISTDYVFSGNSNSPWQVAAELSPQNVYGKSKAAGEAMVKTLYPARSYVVRTAWLYSEYGNNFAKKMCLAALHSEGKLRVVDDQIGQPTNATDLARLIVTLVTHGVEFGTYHATSQGQTSWYGFAREIFKLSGASLERVVPVNTSEFPIIAKRPRYSVLGHEKWLESGLEPLRHWEVCLKESFPGILRSISTEG